MSAPLHIQILPAQPGTITVYDFQEDNEVALGEPVIGWRIETYKTDDHSLYTACMPLTVDGDIATNCIGVQYPDKTVSIFSVSNYPSLEEVQKERYPV